MAKTSFDTVAQDCADKLADQIEAGRAPWDLGGVPPEYPVDTFSGRPVEGVSALQMILRQKSAGYKDSRWLTPESIAAAGANVKKGARPVSGILWTVAEGSLPAPTRITKIPKNYYSIEQCENFKTLRPAPLQPIAHHPKEQFEDMCVLLGYKSRRDYHNVADRTFVNGRNEVIFPTYSRYDNWDKEQLYEALDGIRAITEARIYDEYSHLLKQNDPQKEAEYHLRENLAKFFMQSHVGSKLPARDDKERAQEINLSVADLIRKNPESLFQAAADASRIVNRTIEKSERSYILVDYERQDAKILKADQVRKYVAAELGNLNLSGSVLASSDFQELQKNLSTQGHFNPYQTLHSLNPACIDQDQDKMLCTKLNHCGFSFRENVPPKDRTDSYGVQNLLRMAHARSPLMGKRTEETLAESLIVPDFNRQQWLKEQLEKLSKRDDLPDISKVTELWDDIAYRKRQISSQKTQVSLNNCWLVDFEKNRIEELPTEKAVEQCLELMEKWHEKTPLSAGPARGDLSYQYEKLLDERKERPSTDAPFIKAIESNKDADVCDRFLSPARSGDGEGNIVLRDLDHRGLVICRSVKELIEVTSWQGEELTAQVNDLFTKAGMDFNRAKEICQPKTELEAQQSFTDFCAAQKTRYAVESARREKAEKAALKDAMSRMSPQTMEEVKRNICTALNRMTERTKEPQQQAVQKTQKAPERKAPTRGMSR